MSYLLKYLRPGGMQVEAIRADYAGAKQEASFQRERGAKAIVCYEVPKDGNRTRAFWLINYKVCYTLKNNVRKIISGYVWSFDKEYLKSNLVEGLSKAGYKNVKYYEQPLPLIFKRMERVNSMNLNHSPCTAPKYPHVR